MAGFSNDIVYGTNVDFTGGSPVTGQMVADGQLLIGASVAPFLRANTLTAGAGISITNGAGTITITNTGGGGGGGGANSLAGNSGSATQVGGVINVLGSGGLTTSGSGQTLTVTSTGSLAALNALAGTGYIVQTGANTFAERTFVAGSGISLTNADGVAGSTTITASPIVPTTFTEDAGSAQAALNNLNILGTSAQGISTSGAGSTVTLTVANATSAQKGVAKFDSTNFTVTAGNVTSNALTVTAGTGLSTGGSVNLGGSVTLNLTVPVTVPNGGTGQTSFTAHGVVLGEGASALGVTAAGTNGQVLIGGTGVDPVFATIGGTQGVTITGGSNTLSIGLSAVPNSALANSSITISAGAGISVVGSPVSLGGTVTISATGTIVTQFSADVGVATPSGNNVNLLGTATQGLSTSASGATVTFTNADATSTQKGVAKFSATDFTVSGGNVVLNTTGAGKTITGDSGGALSPTLNNWNILGGTNISTSGAGSTLTVAVKAPFAATTLTSNSLLLGNGSSNISALGAATNGQIPIGSTGNAPVLATLTAGTDISIVNAAGSITINNTAASTTSTANAKIEFVDDMIYGSILPSPTNTATMFGPWLGKSVGTQASITPNFYSDNGHPGVFSLNTGTTNTGLSHFIITGLQNFAPFILGGGALTATFYFKIPQTSTVSDRFTLNIGLYDDINSLTIPDNGCYFKYSDNLNSGNWQCLCSKGAVTTTSNTSTAVTVGWWVGQIAVNAAGTSVDFKLGSTLSGLSTVATIATNIPILYVSPAFTIFKSIGTTDVGIAPDLVTISQTLTTAR